MASLEASFQEGGAPYQPSDPRFVLLPARPTAPGVPVGYVLVSAPETEGSFPAADALSLHFEGLQTDEGPEAWLRLQFLQGRGDQAHDWLSARQELPVAIVLNERIEHLTVVDRRVNRPWRTKVGPLDVAAERWGMGLVETLAIGPYVVPVHFSEDPDRPRAMATLWARALVAVGPIADARSASCASA